MLVNRRLIVLIVCVAVLGWMANQAAAVPENAPHVYWLPDPEDVPVDFNTAMDFETAAFWAHSTYPVYSGGAETPFWPGQESSPPGFDSAFFLEGYRVVEDATASGTYTVFGNGFTGTVLLDQNTTVGAMALGNSSPTSTPSEPDIQKLVIAADVVFTGLERREQNDGWYNTALRHIRVGRGRNSGDQYVSDTGNYFDVNAWGIVQQVAGLVDLQQDETTFLPYEGFPLPISPQTNRAEILLSSDKDKSGGSIWEVGGTASLIVPDEIRMSDRETIEQMSGHAIFRVRGSNHTGVGSNINVNTYVDPQSIQSAITVGFPVTPIADPSPSGDLRVVSRGGMWGIDQPGVDTEAPGYDPNYGTRHRYNQGKAILEFVLDAGGVTPIVLEDQLVIGGDDLIPAANETLGGTTATPPGFLRIRLMEPTNAGFTGEDPIYLVHADRIGPDPSDGFIETGTEFDQGRFFDPDRDGFALSGAPNLTPHRRLWNGDTVVSEYAGATYEWTIEYFEPDVGEGDIGGSDDQDIDSYVRLVNGSITAGLPGDVQATPNSVLDANDIDELFAAMGTPVGLGSKQNKFDLDGDEDIDYDDAIEWVTHAGFANTLFGDLNLDQSPVVQADLDALLGNLGNSGGWTDGDLDGDGLITTIDRDILLANCTGCSFGLQGDYNGNGKIDPADYTVWRDAMPGGALINDDDGLADEGDFTYWRAHFGETSGAGAGSAAAAAVPEPASLALAVLAVLGLISFRRRA